MALMMADRYYTTGRGGIEYVTTLSADAAAQVARLADSKDAAAKSAAKQFFHTHYKERWYDSSWQQWNLSVSRFYRIWESIYLKFY